MKKATTIHELADNLDPSQPIGPEDKNVYVPIYDEILSRLRDRILNDRLETRTLFVAGQSGTGKTTALNFLADNEIEKSFCVKIINCRDLFDLSDVDIIDVLLMIGFELVKDTALEKSYFERLEKIRKIHKGILKEEEVAGQGRKGEMGVEASVSASTGFLNFIKMQAKFFSSYRMEQSYRKEARSVFELKKPELLNTINELIEEYTRKVCGGRKLLLIIDDLDKLKDDARIKAVFIDNRFYLLELRAKKVIAIPVHLTTEPEITTLDWDIPTFCLRLKTNPKEPGRSADEKKKIKHNQDLMRQVAMKRIADTADLIDKKAVDEAIKFSGAIIRQFMQILNTATVDVRRLQGVKVSAGKCKTLVKFFAKHWSAP